MKKTRRFKIIISLVAVAAVIVGAVVVWPMISGGSAVTALAQEVAKTGSIASYYHFSGNVTVRHSESIVADVSATVREVSAQEGDHVAKGDRLIRLSDGTVIKAGVSGEVALLSVEVDDEVQAGKPLIDIVDFENLEIEMKVDEFDVTAISIGEPVQVTINALNRQYESKVIRFNKQASQSGDVSYYIATLSTDGMDGILPGMQVDVKALHQSADNVTVISMSALKFDTQNAPYVTVRDAGGATRDAYVTVGANDGIFAEITSGLQSGQTVVYDPAQVVEKDEV